MKYLLVDFGSTYTKLTAVCSKTEKIIGTSKAITTVETDITEGYYNALSDLEKLIGKVEYESINACSSAAGGLKMTAIGLVKELTVEAAKRACLGAGAKISNVYANVLNNSEIEEIINADIDIILLAGGTNGGNSKCILENAKLLALSGTNIPIVVAGNKSCNDKIKEIFEEHNMDYIIVDNVMPEINVLEIESARSAIRDIFLKKIIYAKGINKAEEIIDNVMMPTPQAVLNAATFLSKGFEDEEGIGDLVVVDIGGATTDIHSIGKGLPKSSDVAFKGLNEPFSKRTVEGDLGMRYSVLNILDAYGEYGLNILLDNKYDMRNECEKRRQDITVIPTTKEDIEVEEALAFACCDIAFSRHVGKLEEVYTHMGKMFYQTGKDLTDVKTVIGTGGVLVNSNNISNILRGVNNSDNRFNELRPKKASFKVDREYILQSMGILCELNKKLAIKLMKKYILEE